MRHSLDASGGFIGRLTDDGRVDPTSSKGSVLNARILWTFSAAHRQTGNADYRAVADRAYAYFVRHFLDQTHGGVYWSVDPVGQPLSTRKQIYSLAFAIYGLSEYYKISAKPEALQISIDLYHWIEQYSFDGALGGYWEAFSREGALLADLRLSEKDRNDPKTMNTHLHVLEGYANLYRVWPDAGLKRQIRALLATFRMHILNADTHHLRPFFTADWQPTADLVSFGHDIEASWLLLEAAQVLADAATADAGDAELTGQFRQIAVSMARATAAGLQADGSLYHELNRESGHCDTHREWWVSAEAMVGFLNAYQLTGEAGFYEQSVGAWQFAQQHLLDRERGEWRWGVLDDYRPMPGEDKIGFWKCPYHNVRACLAVWERLRNKPLAIS
ncbi:MAG: AGE family epimerase/isomerase [Ferruginibacter sp.]|nr:AGE family epimerase/isomerase [Cytophagales bacterium]